MNRIKITIIKDTNLLKYPFHEDTFEDREFMNICQSHHIVAVKQKRGYVIVKHIWHRIPMKFKNKQSLLEHLSDYM